MRNKTVLETLTLILQLGIVMIVSIVACTLGFAWIGSKTGADWLAIIGFILGSAGGMKGVWRLVRKYTKE